VNDRERAAESVPGVRVIGRVRSPFASAVGTPIQPVYAGGAGGEVVVDERYAEALDDIEGFERIWLVYWMDGVREYRGHVVPYRDTREHGLFATRSPSRPNPIGLSAVRLLRRAGNVLHVADLDILDGTAVLDIKPYVPEFDSHPASRAGWFDDTAADRRTADDRFARAAPPDPEEPST
jgi:tRNA (adenine37-N6)-methyltransferase